eukprot:CAMPEP_0203758476 /NCGR_PEP_ID=MMETSP0098-20131031/11319_1 /ASSEMBLY_ACC=CAM_ASM_000208 /TAXON_ID=96639 /ORGANISM=" , Strain NY0313808BC1" /LENGTH=557 /DNA_ID=CAMNT_0050650941 /DNA_START=506 /DNA_END=2179 /DNA_ORIENTATION=-
MTMKKPEVRTLASLEEERDPKKQKVMHRTNSWVERKGTAVVIASAVSHQSDKHDKPTHLLLELGGVPVICHVLWQLSLGGLERIVVVIGCFGDQIREQIANIQKQEADTFSGVEIEYVDLGVRYRGGYSASILEARKAVKTDEQFVLVASDHIVNEEILREMVEVDLSREGDDACVLVENDLKGMVGLPQDIVCVQLRPLHGKDRVYAIGPNLPTYGGIDAGVVTCSYAIFEELQKLQGGKSFELSTALEVFASRGSLKLQLTEGRMWFAVETEVEREYVEESLSKHGQTYVLKDGKEVRLVGLPKRIKTSPTDGSEWAEFNVAKWRSAVFTTNTFFDELYKDTTHFIAKLCEERGGAKNVLLVEVGCGTGEALLPLSKFAKYSVGIDFNPNFVSFCNKHVVTPENKDRLTFIQGDAQELDKILETQIPKEWSIDSLVKVIVCVGNTVGIMPEPVKQNVYKQMLSVAGSKGCFVVVFWNGNMFGHAVQHFYYKNPQLCGKFKGDSIDISTCTLTTPSGYRTHWTTPEEARSVFETQIGAKVLNLEEKGKGVLVSGCK